MAQVAGKASAAYLKSLYYQAANPVQGRQIEKRH
jgi:hypothetical protein